MADVAQHVVVRGNNSERLFNCPHDCSTYLNFLHMTSQKYSSAIHSYALMPNHVHLLMSSTIDCGVSKTLQALARHYVPYFNQRYDRRGALFAARYRSALVEQGQPTLNVYRYIEGNPVRAALCCDAKEYTWTSYKANAFAQSDKLITPSNTYTKLADTDVGRSELYRELWDVQLSAKELQKIRSQTNRSRFIGSDGFREKIEKHFNISLATAKRGGDRRSDRFRAEQNRMANYC